MNVISFYRDQKMADHTGVSHLIFFLLSFLKKGDQMIKKISCTVLILSSMALYAQEVKVFVHLLPAGSFEAISKNIKGEAKKNPDGSVMAEKVSILIKSLKTDIDLRDEHFWKHLNSEKFPKITLSSVKGKNGKAKGQLEIGGLKKPVDINYKEIGKKIMAKFSVNSYEYKLPVVNYMGVGVDKMVEIEAEIPFIVTQ